MKTLLFLLLLVSVANAETYSVKAANGSMINMEASGVLSLASAGLRRQNEIIFNTHSANSGLNLNLYDCKLKELVIQFDKDKNVLHEHLTLGPKEPLRLLADRACALIKK
jgi:hypothetical protein